jgi:hypothetical protein
VRGEGDKARSKEQGVRSKERGVKEESWRWGVLLLSPGFPLPAPEKTIRRNETDDS